MLHAAEVSLAWDANTEPDVVGYKIYYGTPAGSFTSSQDLGNTTTATVPNLGAGQAYSFYVTCYNTSGLESEPSNIVTYTVPGDGGQPQLSDLQMTTQGMEMRWVSTPGTTYRILYKNDLSEASWQVLDQVLAGGSSIYWVDSTAAAAPRRFYRIEVLL